MRPRIASLVPSVTELLVSLGLQPWLVARTGFCIHPAEALRGIPKVGGTKDVKLDRLRELAPTHVIVNIDENRLETVEALAGFGAKIIVTHPLGPEDNLALVDQMVAHFGNLDEVSIRAQALREAIAAELAATRPDGRPMRRVLYLIWRDPWMTVARDTYLSRMLARIGWQTWPPVEGGERGARRYPVLSGNESWLREVDLVLLSSEPYAFGPQHVDEARRLCPQARVQIVDGEALSWYGSRSIVGLSYLRRLADDAVGDIPWTC